MFKRRVRQFIDKKNLFSLNDRVLVALSGGADSVALLRVLVSMGYKCIAAHCNFHLRGEESDRDEAFVRALCESLDVPLYVQSFDTYSHAHSHGISIEMSARELRYKWFEELCQEVDAQVIAVAHHRDDSVETILLNLIRGTGIDGLCGIHARVGYVVRPLLEETRESVVDYLQHLHQDYVTDSTNLQDEYTRNKIRLNILPLLQEINPSIKESISQTSSHLNEVAEVYHQDRIEATKRVLSECDGMKRIHIRFLMNEVSPASLLYEILSPFGFNSSQTSDIYQSIDGQSGKRFLSSTHEAVRDRDYIWIRSLDEIIHQPQLIYEYIDVTPSFQIPRDIKMACLDASKINAPLMVRLWKEGDKFVPFGMKGKKLVSDYMTDKKFSIFQKQRQYVACSEGQIVWLVGERIDQRYALTSDTKKALVIRLKE